MHILIVLSLKSYIYLIQFQLADLYKTGEVTWREIMKNTANLGSKGRKVEKVKMFFITLFHFFIIYIISANAIKNYVSVAMNIK